jgi:hypothetical protein
MSGIKTKYIGHNLVFSSTESPYDYVCVMRKNMMRHLFYMPKNRGANGFSDDVNYPERYNKIRFYNIKLDIDL